MEISLRIRPEKSDMNICADCVSVHCETLCKHGCDSAKYRNPTTGKYIALYLPECKDKNPEGKCKEFKSTWMPLKKFAHS